MRADRLLSLLLFLQVHRRITARELAKRLDGWVKLHFLFESEEAACGYVLGFGSQVEVVEPRALREQVIHLAESVVAFYAQKANEGASIPLAANNPVGRDIS